ncbi:MAG: alpha/beta hydrolase [Janthinobacterium lividum]
MIPVVIPSPAGPCHAMYGVGSGPAILFCPSLGDEALRTGRVWRDFAARLGEHGFATLRFDLPGTGNSSGMPTDPRRVEAWRNAVRACAVWLSPRHDGRVVLLGHRFGALLAMDAVAGGVDAERLILLDPPESGASLVRHVRARARLSGSAGAGPRDGDVYIGGMPLSASTLFDVAAMPAPLRDSPPALLVLDERPGKRSLWPDRLRSLGGSVDVIPFDGYDAFVGTSPFDVVPPTATFTAIVDHLERKASPSRGRVASPPRTSCLAADGCSETPIWFGPGEGMFGILCRPHAPVADAPALLLPTMGIDPCSGMSRMWTDLARRVAAQGIASLRFDMRGVGESAGELGMERLVAMYRVDRIADLRHAIDALEAIGFPQVKIVGYCAGAYAAWHAAIPDRRIAAILAGNLVYLNFQRSLASEALTASPGASRIGTERRGLARLLPSRGLSALRQLDDKSRRFVPRRLRVVLRGFGTDPRETRQHVKALIARGCAVSLVMANDDHGHVRLRRAFGERPRLPAGVELTVIDDADHQFSDPCHRARFLDLAASFVLRGQPPVPVKALSQDRSRYLETA